MCSIPLEEQCLAIASGASLDVWKLYKSSTCHRADADDFVQVGQLYYLEHVLPKLDPDRTEQEQRGFVYKAVHRSVRTWAERQARTIDPERLPKSPGTARPPDDNLIDLRTALATLDDADRAMILDRYAGRSMRQVGERHNLSAGQVQTRVRRIEAKLRKLLT